MRALICLILMSFFTYFTGFNAYGKWSKDAKALARKIEKPFDTAEQISFWSSVKLAKDAYIPIGRNNLILKNEVEIHSKFFGSKKMPIYEFIQRDKEGKVKKAPLIFFMSGMFSVIGGGRSKSIVNIFGQDDAHVIYLPNPWGKLYIEQKPSELPGDLFFESKVGMETIQQYLKKYGKKINPSKIFLFGESYGGLLAIFMAYLDAKRTKPLFNGGIRILSPPLHFQKALQNLDRILDEEKTHFENVGWWKKLNVVSDFIFANTKSDLNVSSKKNVRALMSYMGFNRKLFGTYEAIQENGKYKLIPNNLSSSDFEEWKNQLRFAHYYTKVNDALFRLFPGQKAFLNYWYKKCRKLGYWNIKFVSAKDDFLNIGLEEEWFKFDHEALLLPSGGHSGYLALEWFQKIRQHLF